MTSPSQYLLDTSAVIDLPTEIEPDAQFLVSSITVAELNAGIHTTASPVERASRLARLQWVEALEPLPFTTVASRMYGQVYAMVLAAGRNPRPRRMDLLIASIAAAHQLPLITRNEADFADLKPLVQVVAL